MNKTIVHPVHVTILQAFCEADDCTWTHTGQRSLIRAQQHATEEGHITTFQRSKEITYTPDNLKSSPIPTND